MTEELKSAYEAGEMLQYQKENGEWVDFSKNTVCDDFKFQEYLNYRIKPKCKWTPPNGQETECKPSLICGDCEYNTFKPIAIKYEGPEFEACQDEVKYKSTDGKNWVLETEHKNCKTGYILAEHDYTKIQNYIEAIRLIAEKIRTAESDCIEQLARDVGNYLYDLVKGDK